MGGLKDTLLGDTPYTLPSPPAAQAFDGETYSAPLDHARLRGQLGRVADLMSDGRERTLAQIAEHVGGTEAAVSARLRDLRKPKYGARDVRRRRIDGGLHVYRVTNGDTP